MTTNYYGGAYQTPARVPNNPGDYSRYLDQFHPGWKESVMAGNPYPVEPGKQLPGGFGGVGNARADLYGAGNPLNILQGDPYKRLLELARGGSGAVEQAKGVMAPAMDYARGMLGQTSPLGAGRGELAMQQGQRAMRSAGTTARRSLDESAYTRGRAGNPEALSFSKAMTRFAEAEGLGTAGANAQSVELDERRMNEEFRSSMASVLQSMGLGLGGLGLQDTGLQTSAAIGAGQLESFARNAWGEILARLLGAGQRNGMSMEDRSRQREQDRTSNFGEIPNLFPSFDSGGILAPNRGRYS